MGYSTFKMLTDLGFVEVLILDSNGIIYKDRPSNDTFKQMVASQTNPKNEKGNLKEAI